MRHWATLGCAVLLAALLVQVPPRASANGDGVGPASFTPLGDLPGGAFRSEARAVSSDGLVVVGDSDSADGTEALRWTRAGGLEGLGDLPGGLFLSTALGISADGAVIVGSSQSQLTSGFGNEAFRWTRAGGMVGLGELPGGSEASVARAASADGSVIAGTSSAAGALFQACGWFSGGPPTVLPDLAGGIAFSNANGVSGDGSRIVGQGTGADGLAAATFSVSGAALLPTGLPGIESSGAFGISQDGTVIVGSIGLAEGSRAARWTAAGIEDLGDLAGGGDGAAARACSLDGSVIVGSGQDASGPTAFVWTRETGMVAVRDRLAALGVPLPGGWSLFAAYGVSGDGRTIVGTGINGAGQTEGWVAYLGEPVAVPGAFLPTSLKLKRSAREAERSTLSLSGQADVGTKPVDFSSALTVRVGTLVLTAPSLDRTGRKEVWRHDEPGLRIQLTPRADTSRVDVLVKRTGDLGALPEDGGLDLVVQGDAVSGAAAVEVAGGTFRLGSRSGELVAPLVHPMSLAAKVPDGKSHTFTLICALAGASAPAVPVEVTVRLGEFTETVPAAAFRVVRGKYVYAAPKPGVTNVIVDPAKERVTVSGKGVDLGPFVPGANPVDVRIAVGALEFDDRILAARRKDKLGY